MFRNLFKKREEKKEPNVDYLVVGLGNPGEDYKKTAHNAGFRIVSRLREISSLPDFSKDNTLRSFVSKGEIEGKRVALLLPLTFMNLSGEAIRKALERFCLPPERLILVHDDSDLFLGTLRFSFSRGSAGHKGVASVIKSLRTKKFVRLRVGIRKRAEKKGKNEKAIDFVLKSLPASTKKVEEKAAEELKNAVLSEISAKTINLEEEKNQPE